MRKKIEELRNKEEGFTLVELLAVIVILGIIVAIAIPAVGSVVNNARDEASKAEIALVVDAARLYDIENPIPDGGVSVTTLEKSGYLETKEENEEQTPRGMVNKDVSEDGSFSYKFTKGPETDQGNDE